LAPLISLLAEWWGFFVRWKKPGLGKPGFSHSDEPVRATEDGFPGGGKMEPPPTAVIFFTSRALGVDRRLCTCLGAGGAICGVSGAIAMAGAVKATKEQVAIAVTLVILWAIVMIFLLPFVSKLLQLHTAVAGAWIGNSEFADAAGLAAAQAYGGMAEASAGAIQGTTEQALATFTLMKVIGRDIWIGIWVFIFALIATLRWEVETTGSRPSVAEIWWRFPKFVLGFLIASAFITLLSAGYSMMSTRR
jgi:uncharacterized membrane protein YadS